MSLLCTHCGIVHFTKNGTHQGIQRYKCKTCAGYFSSKPRKFSYQSKAKAIEMYMNHVGIRKIAKFIECSSPLIVRWIKALSNHISSQLAAASKQVSAQVPDIIEVDEVYTFVKKQGPEQLYGVHILGEQVVLLRMELGEGIVQLWACINK